MTMTRALRMATWAVGVAVQAATSVTADVQSLCFHTQLRAIMGNEPTAHAVGARTEGAQLTAAIGVTCETAAPATIIHIWWAT